MGYPEPVTPPELDLGRRAPSAYDLEKTLVGFFTNLFSGLRLDNPTLNLAQPDVVPFDPELRAQMLELKVAPRVERGSIPRTVTGEINLDKLSDSPAIIVQVVNAHVDKDDSVYTVRILFSAFDENPNASAYQDVENMMEAAAIALTSFGQQGIDQAYPIVLPLDWKLVEAHTVPHAVGEMTAQFRLRSARPMPDMEKFGIVPAESVEMKLSTDENYY